MNLTLDIGNTAVKWAAFEEYTLLEQGYVFLGYVNAAFESVFDPPLDAELRLTDADRLIVLGEK